MDANAAHRAQLEGAAEDVAETKQYLIDLDRRQNQFREARRALQKNGAGEEVWLLCSGKVFVKSELRHGGVLNYLSWKLNGGEKEIERSREELKSKVAYLAELEGPDQPLSHLYKGFELQSIKQYQD
ncbi:p53 and DNA damage-regulated protein 1 [Trypanosoma grayi]|uniref:p53 and DNA damage-regulated protein 1 n=1 Tax=Trypanosoma grayi TaxID=71804 RepID=UPI0004F48519|nr:p53 and DNA damage-regulated protein 1 [Trypanosoma grayi]KEG09125.1 p53 and DNA damage-regulated protein 1 [Trypanosoma grayi]